MKSSPSIKVSLAGEGDTKTLAGRNRWEWISNPDRQRNLSFIFKVVSGLVAAAWAIYIYFNQNPPVHVSATTNHADSGGVAVIGSNNSVIVGITLEQHEAALKRREQEIRTEYDKVIGEGRAIKNKEKISLLEKELGDVQAQAQNLATSLMDRKATLVRAGQALVKLNHGNPQGAIDSALQALYKGYTTAAEAFFSKALAAGNEQAAESAFQLGNLAYNSIDYSKAYGYYVEAARLQPQNSEYLNMAGHSARDLGRYAEARNYFEKSLTIRKKSLTADHPNVAQSLNNLAQLCHLQGQYVEAESFFKDALAIYEKALGPSHPSVAQSLNNLAELYRIQERYAEAEPLFKRSLAIQEEASGPSHPDIAAGLSNLALLYTSQHQYALAEPLFKRSLAIQEKTLGPNHPHMAVILNNLGVFYQDQGKYIQAEPFYKRSWKIHEKALGPDHPQGANILSNLAALYEEEKQSSQAESLYKRCLELTEDTLGPGHPEVIKHVNNLISFYKRAGREKDALAVTKRDTSK